MPKPTNKKELAQLSQENYEKLNLLIDSFSKTEQHAEFPDGTLNRNIRDVLGHLHHWHLLLLNWYSTGMNGGRPEMPSKGYSWKNTPELNKIIWETYLDIGLEEIRVRLNESHKSLKEMIWMHSDEELFEKKRYKWTGSTSLGAYLISATSSHYDWALKLIKKVKAKKRASGKA